MFAIEEKGWFWSATEAVENIEHVHTSQDSELLSTHVRSRNGPRSGVKVVMHREKLW